MSLITISKREAINKVVLVLTNERDFYKAYQKKYEKGKDQFFRRIRDYILSRPETTFSDYIMINLIALEILDHYYEEMPVDLRGDNYLENFFSLSTIRLHVKEIKEEFPSLFTNFVTPKPQTTKEDKTMVEFKTVDYVDNKDVNDYSFNELVEKIATLEHQAAHLASVRVKSKAIKKRVKKMYKDVDKLAKILDEKYA